MNSSENSVTSTVEQAIELGLKSDEFDLICDIMGRTPNFTEPVSYTHLRDHET